MLKSIRLSGGRKLRAGISKTKTPSPKWLVYVPESGAHFHYGNRRELYQLIPKPLANEFNFLAINKPGLGPKKRNLKAFEKSFRRRTRVYDAVAALEQAIPRDGQIYLLGYSEGAYLAPEIALKDKRMHAVILIGGGTRSWLKEEVSTAKRRDRKFVREVIKDIYKNPKSLKVWNGFSYATWFSYRNDDTLLSLRKLKVPVLAVIGAKDHVVDFKNTIRDLKSVARSRKNKSTKKQPQDMQIVVLKRCGHSFAGHWPKVQKVLRRYLNARS